MDYIKITFWIDIFERITFISLGIMFKLRGLFLQVILTTIISPHDRHPCLRLTVPAAMSVADVHRQVIAHAERTENVAQKRLSSVPLFS